MKSILATILTLFYLTSSVGFAAFQHRCLASHAVAESHSCCDGDDSPCTDALEIRLFSSCKGSAAVPQPSAELAGLVSGKCCETTSSYHQINEPCRYEQNISMGSSIDTPVQILVPAKKPFLQLDIAVPANDAHFQLNLPLLI